MILTFEEIEQIIEQIILNKEEDSYKIFISPGKYMIIKEFENITNEHNLNNTNSLDSSAK